MNYRMYVNTGGDYRVFLIDQEECDMVARKGREDWYIYEFRGRNLLIPRRSIMLIEPDEPTSSESLFEAGQSNSSSPKPRANRWTKKAE